MSGGDKNKAQPAATGTQTPQQATMTIPAFMPGMQQALADQLAMGYGQQPADLMTYLSSIYKPMTVPDYSAQATPAPATPASTPVAASSQRQSGTPGTGIAFARRKG